MAEASRSIRKKGEKIAFVPTMGYLHKGHLSLIREGKKRGDHLVVSIFVNPIQFAEGEDLERYPRNMQRDGRILDEAGVDILFSPSAADIYPQGFQTHIDVEEISKELCGASRPGHFKGVATVVAKLFNIVSPHIALFGEKDYQQLVLIRRMTADLNYDTDIVGMPVIREDDGLAMSSRNSYLSEMQRRQALTLYRSLMKGKALFTDGVRNAEKIIEEAKMALDSNVRIDYMKICNIENLAPIERIEGEALFALAAYVGDTRLIDNIILREE